MIIELTRGYGWDNCELKAGSQVEAEFKPNATYCTLLTPPYNGKLVDLCDCIEVKETPSEDTNAVYKTIGGEKVAFAKRIEPDINNHDSHYSSDQIETINIQEQLILTNLPKEHHEQVLRNFRIATAFKYISRCGKKDDVKKEITKAINYLTRARDGEWAK